MNDRLTIFSVHSRCEHRDRCGYTASIGTDAGTGVSSKTVIDAGLVKR